MELNKQVQHEIDRRLEKKTIYIAGKIANTTDYLSRFRQAERKLKEMYPNAEIINPAQEMRGYKASDEEYLMLTRSLLEKCDTIYLMNGWRESVGATFEANYGYVNEFEIMMEG